MYIYIYIQYVYMFLVGVLLGVANYNGVILDTLHVYIFRYIDLFSLIYIYGYSI